MISSPRNKRVTSAVKLKKRGLREQEGRFLVEGAQATAEALEADAVEVVFHVGGSGGRVPEVVQRATEAGADVLEVSDAVMAQLTSAVTPQGLVAVARFVDDPLEALQADGLTAVLCSVRDPGNAGTILRSADASGAAGVAFAGDSVDVYNPKTVRASAGSLFHLPVVRSVEPAAVVEHLRSGGAQVLAADSRGEATMYEADLARPTALLFGNEAWGLPADVLDLADGTVRVPIAGAAESLNLAAAAALLLFEAARQRGSDDVGSLVSATAHDLRLPLTALKGFASTLVDRWDRFEDAARRELVGGMLLDLERVGSIVSLILDAARASRGGPPARAERIDVAKPIGAVAGLFDRSPDYPEVRFSGSGPAAMEPARIQAVAVAALEGTLWWGTDGPVEIEATPQGEGTLLLVRRPTADPFDPERVFEVGAEGKIALHLARRVLQAQGGSMTAEFDGGVVFRLVLPG